MDHWILNNSSFKMVHFKNKIIAFIYTYIYIDAILLCRAGFFLHGSTFILLIRFLLLFFLKDDPVWSWDMVNSCIKSVILLAMKLSLAPSAHAIEYCLFFPVLLWF